MCGITGYVTADGAAADGDLVLRMTRAVVHRGPDDEGIYTSGPVGLGFRRLSIIDLAGGHQPLANEDGTVRVVFNGEIYNYRELRRELIGRGHVFRTQSDTETIVHAYEEWGDDAVARLNGMFGFAILDERGPARLLLARDRFGIKPLYYYEHSTEGAGLGLVFGSEAKSLLAHPDVPRRPDPESIALYLGLGYVPAPRTAFADIRKLPPGHLLVYQKGRAAVRRYAWPPAFMPTPRTSEGHVQAVEATVRASVQRQLMSDVPLGALLSGGLDSSIVVACMARRPEGVEAFSASFADRTIDETPFARVVADRFGAHHYTVSMPETLEELLPRLVWHLEEPLAEPVSIPLYLVCGLARTRVKVVLTGEGSDELFAGYARFRRYLRLARVQPVSRMLPEELVDALPRSPWAVRRTREILEEARDDLGSWIARDLGLLPAGTLGRFAPGLAAYAEASRCHIEDVLGTAANATPLEQAMRFDMVSRLPDYILLKNDKLSMAHGLEARVPFLDNEVAAVSETVPTQLKLHGGEEKYVLREAFRRVLPEATLSRRKFGFSAPAAAWMRRDGAALAERLATPARLEALGGLDVSAVRAALRMESGESARLAFGLAMLLTWHAKFFP
jgi:asparagine synthase (glutamine-hydrolysing)